MKPVEKALHRSRVIKLLDEASTFVKATLAYRIFNPDENIPTIPAEVSLSVQMLGCTLSKVFHCIDPNGPVFYWA